MCVMTSKMGHPKNLGTFREICLASEWKDETLQQLDVVLSFETLWCYHQKRKQNKCTINNYTQIYLGGGVIFLVFLPLLGEKVQFDEHIFQTGLVQPPTMIYNNITTTIRPGRITWNLQITHLERKVIFQTSMIMVHVNFPGCNTKSGFMYVSHP